MCCKPMGWGAVIAAAPRPLRLHRDDRFLMPEKTHACDRHHCRLVEQALLELLRRAVAERRVQPSAIVIPLEELADVSLQIGAVAILAGVDLLLFQGLHEALAFCVVVGVSGPAHAGLDAMFQQQVDVGARGVLHAASE